MAARGSGPAYGPAYGHRTAERPPDCLLAGALPWRCPRNPSAGGATLSVDCDTATGDTETELEQGVPTAKISRPGTTNTYKLVQTKIGACCTELCGNSPRAQPLRAKAASNSGAAHRSAKSRGRLAGRRSLLRLRPVSGVKQEINQSPLAPPGPA